MHKSIIHLKTKENLKMLSLLTSLLKALTKQEDGNFLPLCDIIALCLTLLDLDDPLML